MTSVPGFLLKIREKVESLRLRLESRGTISSVLVSVGRLEHFEKSCVHCLLTVVKAILNVGLRERMGRGGGRRGEGVEGGEEEEGQGREGGGM